MKYKVNVYVNNNPASSAVIESTSKKQVWNFKSNPYIMVEISDVTEGSHSLVIKNQDSVLFNETVIAENQQIKQKIILTKSINNLSELTVIVNEQKTIVTINQHKLFGKATYTNGQPVKNPIVYNLHRDIVTVGDELGNYEILVSNKEQVIAIFADSYSKETLEAWFYNVELNKDLELDIIIDKMEVYRLHMWQGEMSDYLHFIPMSLKRIQHHLTLSENPYAFKESWPTLSKKDVKVYANDKEIDILSFQEVQDIISKPNDKIVSRPSYVLSIPKGYNNNLIRVNIIGSFYVNNEEFIEEGNGYYIFK